MQPVESRLTNFKVVGERIVVLPDPVSEEYNGLVLPETRAAQPVTGVIQQVGPGVQPEGFYQPGMRLVYAERAGILTRINDYAYRILDPSEVNGILPNAPTV